MYVRVILLSALLAMSGCALLRPPPFPPLAGRELAPSEAAPLREQLQQASSAVRSLRTLARARIKARGRSVSLRYLVVFEKPDHLRVEAFPLNAVYTMGLLAVRPGRSLFIDPQERKITSAADAAALVRTMLHLPLTAARFMAAVAGVVDAEDLAAPDLRVFLDPQQNLYQLASSARGSYYSVNASDFTLAEARLAERGRLMLSITYPQYSRGGNLNLPEHLQIDVPVENFEVDLRLNSTTVNGDYPRKLYEPEVPEGYERMEID